MDAKFQKERKYQKQAEMMADYLLREIQEHSGSPEALRRYVSGYLEVQLTFANEGRASEQEARDMAHKLSSEDAKNIFY